MPYQLSARALRALLAGTGVGPAVRPPARPQPEVLLWAGLGLLHGSTAGLLGYWLAPALRAGGFF